MNRYSYNGPVMQFGVCVMNQWRTSTIAATEKKARSNFIYQFKKQHNLVASAKIELPGQILLDEEDI